MNAKPLNKIGITALVMLLVSLLVCAAAANIIQVPNSEVNTVGATTSVNLVLDEAPAGLAGYSISITASDPAVATFTDVTFPAWATMKDNTTFPSSSCKISAVDLNEQISSGATSLPLATLTVKGLKAGSTPLVVTVNRMTDDNEAGMNPVVQSSTFSVTVIPVPGQPVIANHTSIKLSTVPKTAIEQAKSKLHIAYGHTSHGSQVTDGMTGLVSFSGAPYGGSLYQWNNGGTGGALDLRDTPFTGAYDLGNPDFTAWSAATRTYLNAHPEINVVMWSWCGEVSSASSADITSYLTQMNQLESAYPKVKFVYMTGHLDGSGESGNLNVRNEQIRSYTRANNKILFDFADIESYDPDGLVNYMKLNANDGCNYNGGNWATAWQTAHPGQWYTCGAAHTEPLNANMKAYAAWWMWARLGGWDGSTSPNNPVPSITGISPGSATAGGPAFTLTVDGSNFISGSIVQVDGTARTTTYVSPVRLTAAIPASDITTTRTVNITVFNPAPGGGLSANTSLVISNPLPKTGNISVTSTPAGAAIRLDGTNTGKITPYTFDNQNTGDHKVEVSLAGHYPANKTVNVVAGSTASTSFSLVQNPTTGSISVRSTPAGAAINLDGANTGKITPYTFDGQNAGDHKVEVILAGHYPANKTVNVVAGSTASASFSLVQLPATGSISVSSTPAGAAINLDGASTGKITPYTFDGQNAGDHKVEVILAGHYPANKTVTVTPGSTVTADFPFEPVTKEADLALAMAVSKATASVGEEIAWTITLTNKGPDDARNIIVEGDSAGLPGIVIPAGSQPDTGTVSGTTWTIPALQKGRTAKLVVVSSFTTTGKKTGVVRIQSAATTDPVLSNNIASTSVTIVEKTVNVPRITKVSPASGEAGKILEDFSVTGEKFQQGATVKLQRAGQTDLVPTNVVVTNAKRITCTLSIPQNTVTGNWDIVVTNPDGQSGIKPGAFRVNAPKPPQVINVHPSSGTAGTPGSTLVLYGSDFVTGANVSLRMTGQSDIIAKQPMIFGTRIIIAVVDLPAGAAAGKWDVTVTNPDGERGTKTKSYTIRSVKGPTVKAIEPSTAKAGKTSVVATVRGSDFIQGASVKLQKTNMPDITATNTHFPGSGQLVCVFDLPADAAPGSYDVVVTNPDLKSGKKEAGFTITNTTIIPARTPTPAKTPIPTSTPAPEYPAAQLTGKVDGGNIRLNWNVITDSRLQGYKVVISRTNANPKYPEDGYIYWITDRNHNYATVDNHTLYNGGDINGYLIAGEKYYFSITAVYNDAKVAGNVIGMTYPVSSASTQTLAAAKVPSTTVTTVPTGVPTVVPTTARTPEPGTEAAGTSGSGGSTATV
jgi:hypothetical protein